MVHRADQVRIDLGSILHTDHVVVRISTILVVKEVARSDGDRRHTIS